MSKYLTKLMVLLLVLFAFASIAAQLYKNPNQTEDSEWPTFTDDYFNITFQYPPDWKVNKVERTNYCDESQLDLGGEDAAAAGPDVFKSWAIEINQATTSVTAIGGKIVLRIDEPNDIYDTNEFLTEPSSELLQNLPVSTIQNYMTEFNDLNSQKSDASTSLSIPTTSHRVEKLYLILRLGQGYSYLAFSPYLEAGEATPSMIIKYKSMLKTLKPADPRKEFKRDFSKTRVSRSDIGKPSIDGFCNNLSR